MQKQEPLLTTYQLGDILLRNMVLTEGTWISEKAIGFINIPGIYSKTQTEAWKRVTDAVHTRNGRIFVQLAHSGSVSHLDFFQGQLPLGPSAINPQEKAFTQQGFKDTLTPAEYTTAQIKETIREYRLAPAQP